MGKGQWYVYILANYTRSVLYVGITDDLVIRVHQHKQAITDGFTKRYNVKFLMYYEIAENPISAIEREKQIKSWSRKRKHDLISLTNPEYKDLFDEIVNG